VLNGVAGAKCSGKSSSRAGIKRAGTPLIMVTGKADRGATFIGKRR
jgi:hypothetical protein